MLNDQAGSTSNGKLMRQWRLAGGVTERWTFIQLADGNDLMYVNADSGLAGSTTLAL